jgi:GT2 family glycosyltransferase
MASKLPPITIIIPTLDSKTLYPTIRSLRNQTYPGSKIHILVVNNGSSKISLPGTKIIYPRRNLGFSRAVNLAIANTSTDFLLICNDDVHAPPSTIAKLVSYLSKHPEAGIVGANNGYSINLFNGSIHPSNKLHPDWISGAFLLTKKSILQ